ncbi:hypothetical protein [Piscinibacter sp. HJYY11]|uniref:hypothetical protein n=1 Tax=Piscinibacter sp. HJYY11 TaxID=2801333 RepID=UPI00191FCFFD|nr:hypothetical protein [Piscinibacter sp. HJYY11]MBL0729676.1 hypothetical protein [Piscinibacter sp. HJYY11]
MATSSKRKVSGASKASGTNSADSTKDVLAAAVADQMPGWRMVGTSFEVDSVTITGHPVDTQQGVDLTALRKKFLGAATPPIKLRRSSAADSASKPIAVFKVAPAAGGPTQVAEMRDGKIRIVTG